MEDKHITNTDNTLEKHTPNTKNKGSVFRGQDSAEYKLAKLVYTL